MFNDHLETSLHIYPPAPGFQATTGATSKEKNCWSDPGFDDDEDCQEAIKAKPRDFFPG